MGIRLVQKNTFIMEDSGLSDMGRYGKKLKEGIVKLYLGDAGVEIARMVGLHKVVDVGFTESGITFEME